MHLCIHLSAEISPVGADISRPERDAEALDPRRAGAREQHGPRGIVVAHIASRDALHPFEAIDIVNVRVAMLTYLGKAVIPGIGVVLLRLAKVRPVVVDSHVHELLPAEVVPEG